MHWSESFSFYFIDICHSALLELFWGCIDFRPKVAFLLQAIGRSILLSYALGEICFAFTTKRNNLLTGIEVPYTIIRDPEIKLANQLKKIKNSRSIYFSIAIILSQLSTLLFLISYDTVLSWAIDSVVALSFLWYIFSSFLIHFDKGCWNDRFPVRAPSQLWYPQLKKLRITLNFGRSRIKMSIIQS